MIDNIKIGLQLRESIKIPWLNQLNVQTSQKSRAEQHVAAFTRIVRCYFEIDVSYRSVHWGTTTLFTQSFTIIYQSEPNLICELSSSFVIRSIIEYSVQSIVIV